MARRQSSSDPRPLRTLNPRPGQRPPPVTPFIPRGIPRDITSPAHAGRCIPGNGRTPVKPRGRVPGDVSFRVQDRGGIPGNMPKIPGDGSIIPGNRPMLLGRGWAAGSSRSIAVPNRFLPTRDSELTDWLDNFQGKIAADPAKYGLTGPESAAVTAACAAWGVTYRAANQPSTRTSVAVAAKKAQKRATLALIRPIAGRIRADTGIADTLKLLLGLHVRDPLVTRVAPPASCPVLAIAGSGPALQTLRAKDAMAPTRRAKPTGVVALHVYRAVGNSPLSDPSSCPLLAVVTRSTFTSGFQAKDDGKVATYFARWTNAKGEMGPWSQPMPVSIAA